MTTTHAQTCIPITWTQIVEACARAAHEVNRAYCEAIGDHSQVAWEQAPDWQKISARNGAQGALEGAGPRKSHEGWCEEKRATGWKFGLIKDPEKKEHPCLVTYDELSFEQRAKDVVFVETVRTLGRAFGHPV